MTKDSAIQAMKDGAKVTHRYFSRDEWMRMEGDTIILEDGVKCSSAEFWKDRLDEFWEDDWSIFIG
jgi:hypothetical protein